MLRAVITEDGRQRILPTVPAYRIEVLDLRGQPDAEERLAAVREAMSHHVFDPSRWPLFDIRATRLDGEIRIHIGMDLLIADAASLLQLYRDWGALHADPRSEEHTSELQSLMPNSYAVLCLKKINTIGQFFM